ncbi:hypothetical protein ACKI1Q_41140 [Streptomyces galilaeus]
MPGREIVAGQNVHRTLAAFEDLSLCAAGHPSALTALPCLSHLGDGKREQ